MTKELYFATGNEGKYRSLRQALPGVLIVQVELDLQEPRSDDLKLIAEAKVTEAYEQLQKPVVANDAGFYIHSLQGFPRAFVNFTLETIGLEGILALTKGKPRECEFRQCHAYKAKDSEQPLYFESTTKGTLAEEPRGETKQKQWSELFKLFIPENETKTLAEMTEEEFNDWRAGRTEPSAITKFAEWYRRKDLH